MVAIPLQGDPPGRPYQSHSFLLHLTSARVRIILLE
jgi:hypothetical protein